MLPSNLAPEELGTSWLNSCMYLGLRMMMRKSERNCRSIHFGHPSAGCGV